MQFPRIHFIYIPWDFGPFPSHHKNLELFAIQQILKARTAENNRSETRDVELG